MTGAAADPAARPVKRKAAREASPPGCSPAPALADNKRRRAPDAGMTARGNGSSDSAASTVTAAAVQPPLLQQHTGGRQRQRMLPAEPTQPDNACMKLGSILQPAYTCSAAETSPAHGAGCQQQQQLPPQQRELGCAPLTGTQGPLPAKAVQAAQRQMQPVLEGLACNLPRLAALLQQQAGWAAAGLGAPPCGSVPPSSWRQAQAAALQHALRLLVEGLEAMPPPLTDTVKPTAGVSYVVQTESRQAGAQGTPRLPHLVIQPPGLRAVEGPEVDELVRVISCEHTAAAVLPLREENRAKAYLLLPAQRRAMLQQQGGRLAEAPGALQGLEPLLQDRTFVCLHYHLDAQGRLHPVAADQAWPKAPGASACSGGGSGARLRSIEASNVQLGVMVRKGVGGTCPLRAAARRLACGGLLAALLDDSPPLDGAQAGQLGPQPATAALDAALGAGLVGPAGSQQAGLPPRQHAQVPVALGTAPNRQQPAAAQPPVVQHGGCAGSEPAQSPSTPCTAADTAAALASAAGAAASSHLSALLDSGCSGTRPARVGQGGAETVCRSLEAAFADALVGAAEADEAAGGGAAAAACTTAAQHATAQDATPEPKAATAAVVAAKDGATAATAPRAASLAASEHAQPSHSAALPAGTAATSAAGTASVAELEAALLRAAADLRAAEAVAAAAAADDEMPDFEAEEAAEEAAEAGFAAGPAGSLGSGSDVNLSDGPEGATLAPGGLAGGGLAEEEGVEELLQELQEQQAQQAQQAQQPAPAVAPTTPGGTAPAATDAASPPAGAVPAATATPLPQPHPRLHMYTLSSRLELYVQRETWEQLGRPARDALFSAVRRVERRLLEQLAAANLRRLLGFARSLQTAVRSSAVDSVLGRLLLGGSAAAGPALPASPPSCFDYNTAVVLAASCALAAESCGLAAGGGTALQVPWPFYLIGTRDSFAHHLIPVETVVEAAGRQHLRTEYFIRADEAPENYREATAGGQAACQRGSCAGSGGAADSTVGRQAGDSELAAAEAGASAAGQSPAVPAMLAEGLLPIGVTTYTQLLSDAELARIEAGADDVDARSHKGLLPDACFHRTVARGGAVKRTKYFFGARYLWTREHLAEPDARRAGGVRVDVPTVPAWMRRQVEAPLVAAGLLPAFFVDSVALNMYHDGSEGIQSHYDDADRFCRPIFSLRLFSDSRLSFGTQLYGYTNGAFCVPMPRGCITVMEAGGYAANGTKHCVRPVDMAGKSAGLILRRINPQAWREAEQLHLEETCRWLGCLSLNSSARAGALLAQRQAARGAGVAGPSARTPRPPRVPAAERREIWRVMQELIRAAEQAERRERLEDVTAQLLLLSALRKVEAADRLGIDLPAGTGEACTVFSLLDDVVSWVERPHAASLEQQRPDALPRGGRARRRGPPPAALEVGRTLRGLVSAVEAEERREQQGVASVAYSLACAVAALAAWEEGGQLGERPAYRPLPLPGLAPTSGSSGAGMAREPADMLRLLLLAGGIAAGLFGSSSPNSAASMAGSAGVAAGEVTAAKHALLQLLRLPNEAALRQAALLAAVPAVAAATKAAIGSSAGSSNSAGSSGSGCVPLAAAALQQVQAAATQRGVIVFLASSLLQCGQASGLVGQPGSAASASLSASQVRRSHELVAVYELAQLPPAPAWDTPLPAAYQLHEGSSIAAKSSSGSRRGGASLWRPTPGPGSMTRDPATAASAAAAGRPQPALGRCLTIGRAPAAVCFDCCAGVVQEDAADRLWTCQGACRRTFHHGCRQPAAVGLVRRCLQCATSHPCFACGDEAGARGTVKCSMASCSRHYHWNCLATHPLARVAAGGRSAKCPLHYCAACGASGDGVPMVQCLRCVRGWHARCRPPGSALVSKKFLLCPDHARGMTDEEEGHLPPPLQQAAQATTSSPEPQNASAEGLPASWQPPPSAPAASQLSERQREQVQQRAAEAAEEPEEEGELPPLASRQHALPAPSSQQPRAGLAAAQNTCSAASASRHCEALRAISPRSSGSVHAVSRSYPAAPAQLLRSASSRSSQGPAGRQQQPKLLQQVYVEAHQNAASAHAPLPRHSQQHAGAQHLPTHQQAMSSPFTLASPGQQQAVPDLDAPQLQQGPPASQPSLASSLSLQPSWQASLASRPALDYGEL